MKLLLLGIVALLVAVSIGSLIGSDNGYILIRVSEWTIQTSATLFAIILFISFFVFYFILSGLIKIYHIPLSIKRWKKHRHQYLAEKYLIQGLTNLIKGRWKAAENNFCKASDYSSAPYIHYLFAARAAQKMQAIDRRDHYIKKAYIQDENSDIIVGVTQAELQLNQNQKEQALATLEQLQSKYPNQAQIRWLLLDVYTQLKDWRSVLNILSSIKVGQLYSQEEIQEKMRAAYSHLLIDAGRLNNRAELENIWENIPNKLKQDAFLIDVYINERLKYNGTLDCEKILRKMLNKKWNASLVRLYGLVEGGDLGKQLAVAEKYLQNHPRDASLLLCLGRLCLKNKLWGKAKSYLEESIEVEPNSEAYYEYARIHKHEGSREQVALCYEKGLAAVKVGTIQTKEN